MPGSASDLADEGDDDYLVLGFGARRALFGIDAEADLDRITGPKLHRTLRQLVATWHPDLRKLVEMLDPTGLSVNRLRTSKPVPASPSTNVTLLGDAIHRTRSIRQNGG